MQPMPSGVKFGLAGRNLFLHRVPGILTSSKAYDSMQASCVRMWAGTSGGLMGGFCGLFASCLLTCLLSAPSCLHVSVYLCPGCQFVLCCQRRSVARRKRKKPCSLSQRVAVDKMAVMRPGQRLFEWVPAQEGPSDAFAYSTTRHSPPKGAFEGLGAHRRGSSESHPKALASF